MLFRSQSLFGQAPKYTSIDMSTLMGSDIYEQAAFRASGRTGAGMLTARSGKDVNVKIKVDAGDGFDAQVETDVVNRSQLNEMGGIPRRTNFNHG